MASGTFAEIKSAWQVQRKPRRSTDLAATRLRFEQRKGPVGVDPDGDSLCPRQLRAKRKAHVLDAASIMDDVRCAVGALGRGEATDGTGAALGERSAQCLTIAANPVWWQRVLHGNETILREEVTKVLLSTLGEKAAFRYAACGFGDVLVKDKSGTHVAPMGCGHRLCPRCGRLKGRPIIKRIMGWLGAVDHGDIFTMVLTQRVLQGESLSDARARMIPREQEYLKWMRDLGATSMASCTHAIWSEGADGWHYHCHLLLEFPRGCAGPTGRAITPLSLRAMWRSMRWGDSVQCRRLSSQLVCGAGSADPALLDGSVDPDMWSEQTTKLAKQVQYPVRDIAQGISAKRMGGNRERVAECVASFMVQGKGWKLRRTYGNWRKQPPAPPAKVVQAESAAASSAPAVPKVKAVCFGTVHRCARMAMKGDRQMQLLFHALEGAVRNDTDFAKRCVEFCRMASGYGKT